MTILLLGPLQSTFVARDVEILKRQHTVVTQSSRFGKGIGALLPFVRLTFVSLLKLLRVDAVVLWFADYPTVIPAIIGRLLGKKVYVIAGGFDVAYIPELHYGARTHPLRWFAVKNTFRFATHIFPVSGYALHALDGVFPRHASATVVHNAVETDLFTYEPNAARDNVVLTVTQADTTLDYLLKGIDFFILLARANPAITFRLVALPALGYRRALTEGAGIPNLEIIPGAVPVDVNHFRRAKVYCQFSIDESFGVAVVEAMACGCFPVVTPIPALQEITGMYGMFTLRDIGRASICIAKALNRPEDDRVAVRGQALQYSIENRARALLELIHA